MAMSLNILPIANDPGDRGRIDTIIWVDEKCDRPVSMRKAQKFNKAAIYKTFTSVEVCQTYLEGRQSQCDLPSIIIIMSGAFGKEQIPKLAKFSCVSAFIIYCGDKSRYVDLRFLKLIDICDDDIDVERRLIKYIGSQNQSTLDRPSAELGFGKDKQDVLKLIWYNTFNKFLFESTYFDNRIAKRILVKKLRDASSENETWRNDLEKFISESFEENAENAIRWYSLEFSLYKCMNTAFRSEMLSEIYDFRYMIKLVCQKLKIEHKNFIKSYRERFPSSILTVYRGDCVPESFLQMIKESQGNLISFYCFFSTSSDKEVAKNFVKKHYKDGWKRVLYTITVNMNEDYETSFAAVDHLTVYREAEHLFSIEAIFRIESVTLIDTSEPFYHIRLSLDKRNQLAVNHYVQEHYAEDDKPINQAILFGKLIYEMGDKAFALKYFIDIENYFLRFDESLRGVFYNNLAFCYNAMEQRTESLKYYQKAQELHEKLEDQHALRVCYHNIASLHFEEKNFDEAYEFALKASNQPVHRSVDHAITWDLLGQIELRRENFTTAELLFRKAFEKRQNYYQEKSETHPSLAKSYENFGLLHKLRNDPEKALECFQRAATIYAHSYVPSHPLVLAMEKQIDSIRQRLNSTRRESRHRW